MAQAHILLCLLVAMGCLMEGSLAHKNHVVGGSFGWSVPDNVDFYQKWAEGKRFAVGERLVFPFRSSVHNILEVDEEDFKNCTMKHVLNRFVNGPAIVDLNEPGPHYYYCGIGLDCEAGQKLYIDVDVAPAPMDAPVPAPLAEPPKSSNANVARYGAPLVGLFVLLLHVL